MDKKTLEEVKAGDFPTGLLCLYHIKPAFLFNATLSAWHQCRDLTRDVKGMQERAVFSNKAGCYWENDIGHLRPVLRVPSKAGDCGAMNRRDTSSWTKPWKMIWKTWLCSVRSTNRFFGSMDVGLFGIVYLNLLREAALPVTLFCFCQHLPFDAAGNILDKGIFVSSTVDSSIYYNFN